MELTKYRTLMSEVEELNKDKEKNAQELAKLSEKLAVQKEYIDKKSIEKIERYLTNSKEDLSSEQLSSLRDLLTEVKLYKMNETLVNEVIAGNYDNVHQIEENRKTVFKKVLYGIAAVASTGLLIFGLYSCNKNKDNKGPKNNYITQGTTTEDTSKDIPTELKEVIDLDDDVLEVIDLDEEETEEITTKETKKSKTSEKETVKTTDSNKKETKEVKETTKTTEKEKTTEKSSTTESNKNTTSQKSKKPTNTSETIKNNSSDSEKSSSVKTGTQTTVVTSTEVVNTDGKLSIEPSTIVRTEDTSNDKKDTTVEIKADKEVPNTDKVEGKDDTTHEIPKNTNTEAPYTGTDEDRHDVTVEEPYTGSLPSLDNIEDNGEEIIIEEPYTGNLPSLDNIEESIKENTVGKVKTLSMRLGG